MHTHIVRYKNACNLYMHWEAKKLTWLTLLWYLLDYCWSRNEPTISPPYACIVLYLVLSYINVSWRLVLISRWRESWFFLHGCIIFPFMALPYLLNQATKMNTWPITNILPQHHYNEWPCANTSSADGWAYQKTKFLDESKVIYSCDLDRNGEIAHHRACTIPIW